MRKIKKILYIFIILLVTILITSCDSNAASDTPGFSDEANNVVIDTTRKMYYTVDYEIEAENIEDIKAEINDKLLEFDGYIQNSSDSEASAKYVYKVPTSNLNSFLDFIDSYGESVNNKNVTATDITSSYSQVEARKEVLLASRAAYLKLLEGDDLNLSDIISVQNKIADIDSELLKIEKDLASYDSLINYSTITIKFYLIEKEAGFFEDYGIYLGELFVFGGKAFMYLLPFICLGGIVIGGIVIGARVRKNKKNIENKNNKGND